MSQLTKKAIVEATLTLAQSKSISKITVRDIVELCGITRNTFYYHFHDIYEVLEDMIDAKFDALGGTWGTDPQNAIYELRSFLNEHRKILFNLYRAIGHEALENYLLHRLHAIIMEILYAENVHYGVPLTKLELIADFYAQAFTGQFLKRMKTEGEDFFTDAAELDEIFRGIFAYCLGNCKGLSKSDPQMLEKNVKP